MDFSFEFFIVNLFSLFFMFSTTYFNFSALEMFPLNVRFLEIYLNLLLTNFMLKNFIFYIKKNKWLALGCRSSSTVSQSDNLDPIMSDNHCLVGYCNSDLISNFNNTLVILHEQLTEIQLKKTKIIAEIDAEETPEQQREQLMKMIVQITEEIAAIQKQYFSELFLLYSVLFLRYHQLSHLFSLFLKIKPDDICSTFLDWMKQLLHCLNNFLKKFHSILLL